MAKVVVMDHPLIQHKIGFIRRRTTGTKAFRETVGEIAMLLCYEATRDLELEDVEIDTPVAHTTAKQLKGKKLAVVPILRAGLGMVDGMLKMIPAAKVGHIGLYRDPKTLEPVEYYCKLPADCAEDSLPVHHCRPRGREGLYEGASRCRPLHRRHGRPSQRERLHRAGPWRCRRPDLWNEVTKRGRDVAEERRLHHLG